MARNTHTVWALLVAVLVMAGVAGPASAVGMREVWLGSPLMYGWVPEDAEAIRGVLIFNGSRAGEWHEAAAHWDFAILCINTDTYTTNMPDDAEHAPLKARHAIFASVVREGLERLGDKTGHPEINHAPLVTEGYSRYSGSAPAMMNLFPDRALGYINGHGGQGGGDDFTNKQVPSMGMQCEWENIFSGGDKDKLLGSWWKRAPGSLGMMTIHWRVYHNPNAAPDLGIIFVDELIKARIPADWDSKQGPAKLKPVDHDAGWLGSHKGWNTPTADIFKQNDQNADIAPVADFQGDPTRASWLLSERMAWAWRAFSSRFPKVSFVEPGYPSTGYYSNPSPPAVGHREAGVRAGRPFTLAVEGHTADVEKVEFFIDTRPVGEAGPWEGGQAALGSSRGATASAQVTLDSPGVYALMARYTTGSGEVGWSRHIPLVVVEAIDK